MGLPSPIEYTSEFDCCRRLWMRVLVRAREDAEGLNLVNGVDRKRLRIRGRIWLTVKSIDLEDVCEMSGVSLERVISKFRKKYGRG
jgi:hypothetical protein